VAVVAVVRSRKSRRPLKISTLTWNPTLQHLPPRLPPLLPPLPLPPLLTLPKPASLVHPKPTPPRLPYNFREAFYSILLVIYNREISSSPVCYQNYLCRDTDRDKLEIFI
jgi:hypothetical protein